jgi:hypothetical protein
LIVHVTDLQLAERMWSTIAPLLKPAVDCSSGCYEVDDVLDDIRAGKQELWVDCEPDNVRQINAAMTTMFDQYPQKKTLKVVFVGGRRMKKWLPEFIQLVEQYAKRSGAQMLEGFFRPGWARAWPGARISGVGLVKDL